MLKIAYHRASSQLLRGNDKTEDPDKLSKYHSLLFSFSSGVFVAKISLTPKQNQQHPENIHNVLLSTLSPSTVADDFTSCLTNTMVSISSSYDAADLIY